MQYYVYVYWRLWEPVPHGFQTWPISQSHDLSIYIGDFPILGDRPFPPAGLPAAIPASPFYRGFPPNPPTHGGAAPFPLPGVHLAPLDPA